MSERDKIGKAYKALWETPDADSLHALRCSILTTVGGSHAYGIHHEESDVDIRGVFIPSEQQVFGLKSRKTVGIKRRDSPEVDLFRDVQDFFALAIKGNPTILEQLFVRPEHILTTDMCGDQLLECRHMFLSKKCKFSFSGYSMQQMSQRRDLKDYAHVMRLLYQGREILTTGTLNTYLENDIERQHIINIREGVYDFEEIQSLYNPIIECYDEYAANSSLPDEVDFNAANALLIEIMKDSFGLPRG